MPLYNGETTHVGINDSNLNARLCPLIRISRSSSGVRRRSSGALSLVLHSRRLATNHYFQSTYTGVKHEYKNTNMD